MDFIIDAITEWIKDFLIEAITGNLSNMFGDVNTKVATIAGQDAGAMELRRLLHD